MAPKAKVAGASASAEGTTETSSGVLVVGAATDTTETAVVEVVAVADVVVGWPKQAVIRNHSGMQLVEPITGKFLFPCSSVNVELRDQEHADAVIANLQELSQVNSLGNDALTLDFI